MEPTTPSGSPQLPHPFPPEREERSQSTGQILRERSGERSGLRERSGGHSLPIPNLAELRHLCPHLSQLREEEEDEEDERGREGVDGVDPDSTPVLERHSGLPSPSPGGSPIRSRAVRSEYDDPAMMRRGSSHSSLVGGLPPSLLPSLTTSASKLPLANTRTDTPSLAAMDAEWPITKSLFQICFPFHIIFDTSLIICHMGVSMSRLLPGAIARDKVTDHFDLLRPIGTFSYQTIRCSIHNPFILAMKSSADDENGQKKALQFRGQMVPVVNSENCPILFIGSPRIETVEDLQLKGLYLTDLPVHDVTRDLILLSHHFQAEVNVAFQLEVTKRELESEKKKVQEEKQRADALLHAMLPPSVTKELTSGVNKVVAEEITMVTILFSDIKDFTTICHRCAPNRESFLQLLVCMFWQG